MSRNLQDYEPIVGKDVIDELRFLGERLRGKIIQNVNSTRVGGGVAEILMNLVPLLRDVGVDARWDVISGNEEFFKITKKFHNALHGAHEKITDEMYRLFLEVGEENIRRTEIYGDLVAIHDPQPITLIRKKVKDGRKWIWRCHVDISHARRELWKFLHRFVKRYDGVIFSSSIFSRLLPVRQFLISPSIDPLSDKNKELPKKTIDAVLEKYGIDPEKETITQISRYDRLKDPVGVVDAFRLIKRYHDCQLVLAGNRAADDPETDEVLAEVRERADGDPDIHVLLIPPENNDIDVNALQRSATVVVQKSTREGFGLVVSEALWKEKPVVAGAVGGIPLQVEDKRTGLLCHSVEGAAWSIKKLLQEKDYARWLAKNAKEHVRLNYLLTRHLRDYLALFIALTHDGDGIIRL